MANHAMVEKLQKNEALDVNVIGQKLDASTWKLVKFVEDIDYCDGEGERWIWSIGRDEATGDVYASTTTNYYERPGFKCLWLR
jgi:malonyl CoA-acyl carrier protein transacylase